MLLPGIATPSCSSSPLSFQSTIFLSRAVNTGAFICSVLGSTVVFLHPRLLRSRRSPRALQQPAAICWRVSSSYRCSAAMPDRTLSLTSISVLSRMLVISASRSRSVVSTGGCIGFRNVSNSLGSTNAIFLTFVIQANS